MKTKIILIFSCILTSFLSFSQLSAVDYKSKDYDQFRASKTYVVLTGNKKYDSEVQAAAKELWKITPVDFIKANDFDNKISDKSASFLMLVDIETGKYGQQYNYFALINGGKKNLSKYKYDDMLAYCPINHFQNEQQNTDCYYRIRNMLQSMILSMDIIQKNDIKGNSYSIVKELQKQYNLKAKNIQNRTLLFCDETVANKLTKADIAGLYPYKFEICSKAKIEQVIKDKSTEYYYFQPGITFNKSMFVFDPSNGEALYFEFSIMGLNINKDNIKDLAKAIAGKK